MQLSLTNPIFIGFKMETSLRRQLEALEGPDRRYVSGEDSTFLRICQVGDNHYVGKVIEDGLSTDNIDDVRRNIVSILQRLCPDTRLPAHFGIWACTPEVVIDRSEG